jgi:protocatechuate 3,4-dioxygenase beta subunit
LNTHRRSILRASLLIPALTLGPVAGAQTATPQTATLLPATPSCGPSPERTAAQTEGPYWRPNAPERRDLASDAPGGRPLMIGGFVTDAACAPLPGAIVEIWQADDRGAYDNRGFRLRGWQRADALGRWTFTTIAPGIYPGRTPHYHVKVQRPGGRVLTTQLYLPDDPGNCRDRLFDARLQLRVQTTAEGPFGRFDFVL